MATTQGDGDVGGGVGEVVVPTGVIETKSQLNGWDLFQTAKELASLPLHSHCHSMVNWAEQMGCSSSLSK